MKLDIIMPHYNEPWEVGKKFFDILAMQRMADFGQVRVIFVNDGEENNLFPIIAEQHYPYEVIGSDIPHQGVSAARNRGLELSDAEWVMFCDFDDVFANMYSLHCFLDALNMPKSEKYDMIWWKLWDEDSNGYRIRDTYNPVYLHAKVFRKAALDAHNLRFNTDFQFGEDSAFVTQFEMEIPFKRIGCADSRIVPYIWTWRKDSLVHDPENRWQRNVDLYHRQIYVADEWAKHGNMEERNRLYIRALCDAFVALSRTDVDEETKDTFRQEVWEFREKFNRIPLTIRMLEITLLSALEENYVTGGFQITSRDFIDWVQSFIITGQSDENEELQND